MGGGGVPKKLQSDGQSGGGRLVLLQDKQHELQKGEETGLYVDQRER